ncbi:MAG TPA: type II toxin-antitoxin system RelE/ParE family toxin [Gemmataceae bacterium]|nr:type II toxin-antitoxin system RelE/ParE family toxin [Gemmataceae bacterium]
MKVVVLTHKAEIKLIRAYAYLEEQRPGLGSDFEQEIDRLLQLISEFAETGGRYGRSRYRFVVARQFSFVIYYRITPAFVRVHAITHGSRRPGHRKKICESFIRG